MITRYLRCVCVAVGVLLVLGAAYTIGSNRATAVLAYEQADAALIILAEGERVEEVRVREVAREVASQLLNRSQGHLEEVSSSGIGLTPELKAAVGRQLQKIRAFRASAIAGERAEAGGAPMGKI